MYLPPDDRRHYVAWSERKPGDFAPGFWQEIWNWYADGDFGHTVALLRALDLSKFKAKEPPPKTPAFWDIAEANRAVEENELQDVLDRMQRPAAVTIEQILAQPELPHELRTWLCERKNRHVIPKYFRECGYVGVRNPHRKQRLWVIDGRRASHLCAGRITIHRSDQSGASAHTMNVIERKPLGTRSLGRFPHSQDRIRNHAR